MSKGELSYINQVQLHNRTMDTEYSSNRGPLQTEVTSHFRGPKQAQIIAIIDCNDFERFY